MEASGRRSLVGNHPKSKRALEMYEDGDVADEEEFDVEVWNTLSTRFKRAQLVLDQNRDLIQRVNNNYRSRIRANIASNVGLINEINGNISRVVEIYSDLSVNFTNIVRQRRKSSKNGDTTTTTTGSNGDGRSSCGS